MRLQKRRGYKTDRLIMGHLASAVGGDDRFTIFVTPRKYPRLVTWAGD
ncbi:hypothetical protein [Reichenbachiella sp. 5M10]|nr:hypothetical protein [Reichenbachiella sp. 5M10]